MTSSTPSADGAPSGNGIVRRISIVAISITMVLVLGVGLLSYWFTARLIERNVQDGLNAEARLHAQDLAQTLNVVLHDLTTLAGNTLVINALVDSEGRQAYLRPYLRDYRPPIQTPFALTLTDYQGQELAAVRRTLVPSPTRQAPWLLNVIRRSQPDIFLETDRDNLRLRLAQPVLYPATRQAEGVLVLEIDVRPLIGTQVLSSPDTRLALLAGERIIAGKLSAMPESSLKAEASLPLATALRSLDLRVVVTRDAAAVLQPLNNLAVSYVFIGFLLLLGAIVAALTMARRITQPLAQLRAMALRVTERGEIDTQIPDLGADEVGDLGRALETMLARLRVARDGLEREVEKRTLDLRESEQRLRMATSLKQAILDSANFSIISTDQDGTIQSFNAGAERMLGYSADEIVGKTTLAGIHVGDELGARARVLSSELGTAIEPGFEVLVAKARRGEADEGEWTYVRKDGSRFPVLLSVTAMRDAAGNVTGFLGVGSDLSPRQRNERMKKEFISTVSHELRTPLTAIRGSLGLILGGITGTLPAASREMLVVADRNCDRLLQLISDILDIEKMESERIRFDMTLQPLPVLLRHSVTANQAYGANTGVWIETEEPLPEAHVRVDPDRMAQVLSNLLSNAIKFSPPGNPVRLSAAVRGEWVRVTVADSGPGVPDEFRSRVFEKFSQADSSDTRQRGGTGLGLSIAKAIVDRHGGHIAFESVAGQGAMFYFELPVVPDAPLGKLRTDSESLQA